MSDDESFYGDDGAPLDAAASALEALRSVNDTTDLDRELCQIIDNDLGNAKRMEARFPGEVWWTNEWGAGVWDGKRFDFTHGKARVKRLAHATAERMASHEAAAFWQTQRRKGEPGDEWEKRAGRFYNWCKRAGDSAKTKAMLEQHEGMKTRPLAEFDADPDVLVVQNGVLRLPRDGSPPVFAPNGHDPALLNTRVCAASYDPGATAPEFAKFLERVMPDEECRAFLARVIGYCLTGHIGEQAYVIFQGKGGDGKSTFLNAIEAMMDGYVANAAIESFLKHDRKGNEHSADIARLASGPRLVKAAEPEQGSRFAEAMLKTVTGGEPVVARAMFREPFEFTPRWKLIISCNRKPQIKGSDRGIWRRTLVLPWPVSLPTDEMDRVLGDKLAAERDGVLNWALAGWEDWLTRGGLDPPKAVLDAVEEYRVQSDPFGVWFKECCDLVDGAREPAKQLYDSYCGWVREATGGQPMSQTAFGRALSELNLQKKLSNGRFWEGVRLNSEGLDAATNEAARQEDNAYGAFR